MSEPLLIVAALNGTRSTEDCPKVPLTPQDLAAEARRSVEAGAGMVHVHARKPDGAASFDFVIDDIVAAIRGAVDVPIHVWRSETPHVSKEVQLGAARHVARISA